ncbi:MAG: aminoacyl-histidine dipeptidase [Lachnospiraceae bacterium]|nr:aminoacyl-histidine dipeptidase [Lachnospiraceae bacterium]
MGKLSAIDYKKVFYYFEEISNVPRGSGYNDKISEYLVNFAKIHNFDYICDEYKNVIIYKRASVGFEDRDTIILQGHMDMVCEKTSDSKHDFLNEGLELLIEDGFVTANGTTLGGDDGIALAYMLAFLDSDEYNHPALECVFTTDEETGMDGSIGLDAGLLHGKYMINLDSEEEGVFLASCAGGLTARCTFNIKREQKTGKLLKIRVSGLKGGHSGTEINKYRENASVILVRLLNELRKYNKYELLNLTGGTKDNVITSEAYADILIREMEFNVILRKLASISKCILSEINDYEPKVSIDFGYEEEKEYKVINEEITGKIISALMSVPYGVLKMSANIEGLVESSINFGTLETSDKGIVAQFSIRSSKDSYKEYTFDRIKAIMSNYDAEVIKKSEYPAWEFNNSSKLRKVACDVYKELFDKNPKVEAIHAGLECGIISKKIEGLDIVSCGPDILDIHTVKERMDIESVKRMYDWMVKVIESLS